MTLTTLNCMRTRPVSYTHLDIAEEYYPGTYYLAGEGVSTYDLMDTVTDDMVKVNLVAIIAVFLVLLISLRSLSTPG